MAKFLKRDWKRYSKLGKGRKKKQSWRSPKGRDNKMREKRRGYPAVVSVGCKKDKKDSGKIKEKIPMLIKNVSDLVKMKKHEIGVIGKIGEKKRIEIVKKAKEMKVDIHNLNILKFLKDLGKKESKKKTTEKKPKEKVKEKKK